MKAANRKGSSKSKSVPAWAILTKAEVRQLYKPEPARKSLEKEEALISNLVRKLNKHERQKVYFLAHGLVLSRIRRRHAKGRRARRGE